MNKLLLAMLLVLSSPASAVTETITELNIANKFPASVSEVRTGPGTGSNPPAVVGTQVDTELDTDNKFPASAGTEIDAKPDIKIKLSSDTDLMFDASLHFQAGFRNQDKLKGTEKNVSGYRRGFSFMTEAAFGVRVAKTVDSIIYGGKLMLVPTTRLKGGLASNGSHIFVESDFGKVELGSPHDAGAKMRITGNNVIAGTGGWSSYTNSKSDHLKYFGPAGSVATEGIEPEFLSGAEYFFDSVFKTKLDQSHDRAEPSRKISYFTPQFNGWQFGVSYIPDSGNTGGNVTNEKPDKTKSGVNDHKMPSGETFNINRNVKDGFSVGAVYEYNIDDGIDLKLAATGEYAKAAGGASKKQTTNSPAVQYKLADLKTYNLGAVLTYGNFSYSASYGSLGKSLTTPEYHKTSRHVSHYNGAVAYSQGPIKTSISYFKSTRFTNTVDTVAIGTEYKFMPGLVPYAEIAYFRAKGRPSYYPDAPKKQTKGTVALIGARLKL